MPSATLYSERQRERRRRILLWSAMGTILLSPFSSALFLIVFDHGGSFDLWTVLFFPILIVQGRGFLTGLVVDVSLIASTFFPIYYAAQRFDGRRRSNSVNVETDDDISRIRSPLSVRLLAIFDFLIAVVIAISAIDNPLAGLIVLIITWPVVFGLFTVKPWGWWAGMIFHVLIAFGGLAAYAGSMYFVVQDFDRPPGHMDLITSKGFAVILTIAVVIWEIIAVVPLLVLLRKRTRQCFLSSRTAAVLTPTPPAENG